MFYTSVMSPITSDHKPVCSLFKIKYKEIDPVQQKIVAQSILDYLNNLKENFVPKMMLSTNEVVFQDIKYGETMYVELEIENEGDGLLEYEISRMVEKKSKAKEVRDSQRLD